MSPNVVAGNHVIMLAVQLPPEIEQMADAWVAKSPTTRSRPKLGAHMTVLFVGKDMPESCGIAIVRALKSTEEKWWPGSVQTLGPIKMFGAKTHVAVMIDPTHGVMEARKFLDKRLNAAGISVKSGGAGKFSPHVTIGISTVPDEPPAPQLRRYDMSVSAIHTKIGGVLHEIHI